MEMTDAIRAEVLAALRAGEKATKVSKRLGVSYLAVIGVAHAWGVRLRRGPGVGSSWMPEVRNDEIVRRLKALESPTDIGREFNITPQRVHQIGTKLGLDMTGLAASRHLRRQARAREAAMSDRKQHREALRAYYALLAVKIREVRLAGYSWPEVGAILFLPTTTAVRIGCSHYPDLRVGKGNGRRKWRSS